MDDRASRWLLTEGRRAPDGPAAFAGLCERLVDDGVPLFRCWYGGLTLHPLVYAAGCTWRRGEPLQHTRQPHGFERSPMWRRSPAIPQLEGAPPLRVRIGAEPSPFPIVDDLAAQGATDYLIYALDLDGKPTIAVSYSTDRPGGFTDEHLRRLHEVRVALAAVLEIHARREIASTVVRTYLGRDAGDRVLAGRIRRGDGETVRAAIWFSDLRGFTTLSDQLGRDALLALLDDTFEAQVGAIEDAGGTALKFMGDGLLAMFGGDEAEACRRAVTAARDAARRVAATNQRRESEGAPSIRYGLALHWGDVQFGNIGSASRLDYTVIGPAVNRAARLEAVCAELGRDCVVSAEFALRCGAPVTALGTRSLKGVAEPVEVFALDGP